MAVDAACAPNAFEAVITTLSFFSICVSWWLVDLPVLFIKPSRQHSSSPGPVRLFLGAVAWNCIRLLQPTYIGLIALVRAASDGGNSAAAWPLLYYFGDSLPSRPQVLRPIALQWAKIVILDGVTLVTQVLLVVYGYTSDRNRHQSIFAPGMWLLSATPACVLGAYLLLLVSPRVSRIHRNGRFPVAAGLLVLAGLAFILSLYLSVPKDRVPATAGVMTLQWVLPLLPLAAWRCDCCGNRRMAWPALVLIFAAAFRSMPLALDVGSSVSDVFWFCRVPPKAGGWVTGVVGGALLLGFAIKGLGDVEQFRPKLVDVWKGQQRGAWTTETYVPLQGDEERQHQSPPQPASAPPLQQQHQQQQQQQGDGYAEPQVFDTELPRRSTDLPSYQDATHRTDSMPPSYGGAAPDGQVVR